MSFAIGDFGHLSVIIAFFSSIVSAIAYWRYAAGLSQTPDIDWLRIGRIAFYVHAVAVVAIVSALFTILYQHRYEYYYAWSHSSNQLPIYYMISCFWEGQEGSFLLWIFWHVTLALILRFVNKVWEAPVLMMVMSVQAFLTSMILGVVIPWLELKIGSSPFIIFKEAMPDLPVWSSNPDYIPEDGNGLNPLLQNYWMVIHPPTLFLGFAATIVPFAYCIGGLYQGWIKEWIRPALPWALFAAVVLGTGILMGGYWAYETLNFGGYWNWDPVENAVYVPWLILIASIHLMISYRSSGTALFWAAVLAVLTFLLILYSTFLTRSGILGNASVHSFTDLGLSGQLLIYLAFFVLLSVVLFYYRRKEFPEDSSEPSVYSREFWIFIGVLILSLAAFQVIAMTSIPVYNSIFSAFGWESNIAPPSKPEVVYSFWQLGFAVGIAILSGIGQFFWWRMAEKKAVWDALYLPILIALILTSIVLLLGWLQPNTGEDMSYWEMIAYITLLLTSIFSVVSNSFIFIKVIKNNYQLTGGAIAHIGIALMLIGILFSAGYSKIVSLNTTGLLYNKDFDTETNRDNLLLFRDAPETMLDMKLQYKGQRVEIKGWSGFVDKEQLLPTPNPYRWITKKALVKEGKSVFASGDTVELNPENTFYEILYSKANGDTFTLFPRVQQNPRMGNVVSPDIKRFWTRDLYSHLSALPLDPDDRQWSPTQVYTATPGDTLFINDYVVFFQKIEILKSLPGVKMKSNDVAFKAHMTLLGPNNTPYAITPTLVIDVDQMQTGSTVELNEALGVRIVLTEIKDIDQQKYTFEVNTCQKDYIVLKVIEKPGINILWIGTLLVVLGISMAAYRRYKEFILMRDKGMEV